MSSQVVSRCIVSAGRRQTCIYTARRHYNSGTKSRDAPHGAASSATTSYEPAVARPKSRPHTSNPHPKTKSKTPARDNERNTDDPENSIATISRRIEIRGTTPLAGSASQHTNKGQPPLIENGVLYVLDRGDHVKVPGRWVRDICPCPQCRNQDTAQRQINVFQADSSKTRVASADMSEWPKHVKVKFEDGHETIVKGDVILGRRSYPSARAREGIVEIKPWTSSISENPPSVEYETIQAGPGMAVLMQKIRTHGFAFVDNMPATPEATQALLETIGPIRNTHYGGFYDFTSDLSSKDTAYTSEALEPHTDNTYFTEPAGLQALHLLSHTDGSGGESSLVDGFAAAEQLFKEHNGAYLRLSMTGVYAHASGNDGISIQSSQAFPTFTHSEQYNKLIQVRWNNADRAGVATPWPHLDRWYDAAGKFDSILNNEKNQYWFQLKPGRMLLFDNWRCLHGRSAFTGKRRMCGGYIGRDDYVSRFRTTNLSKEELEASTVTG
ncbi:hypothetical protein LTR10_006389 [Elasticomyces elasticus]|nr:hypothetical protein LTR10_006389 [Elasticomyces elasticus]KAK4966564.1 hypothetical protein LTR42_010875 [Elasticomyces elasticus]